MTTMVRHRRTGEVFTEEIAKRLEANYGDGDDHPAAVAMRLAAARLRELEFELEKWRRQAKENEADTQQAKYDLGAKWDKARSERDAALEQVKLLRGVLDDYPGRSGIAEDMHYAWIEKKREALRLTEPRKEGEK